MKIDDLLTEAKKELVLDTEEKVNTWLTKRGKRIGGTWTIDKDLRVTVDGDVDLAKTAFAKIPVNFKKVTGKFTVANSALETLEGCPEEVGKWFNCSYTKIVNLVGGPKKINTSGQEHSSNYYANNNLSLKSLNGIAENAEELNIGFCSNLEELDYLPKKVRRITACRTGVKTLLGIHKKAPNLEGLQINASPVEEGILSLMKISSFKIQSLIYKTGNEDTSLTRAGKILDRINSSGGDIFDAQSELIDDGLDKMAKF